MTTILMAKQNYNAVYSKPYKSGWGDELIVVNILWHGIICIYEIFKDCDAQEILLGFFRL